MGGVLDIRCYHTVVFYTAVNDNIMKRKNEPLKVSHVAVVLHLLKKICPSELESGIYSISLIKYGKRG